jgi:FemAB family
MARWELLNDETAQRVWDQALLCLDDYSVFQTYSWGQYRRALGWEPCYWAAYDDKEKIVAMMLGGLKRYPFGLGLVSTEGGPVGDLTACDESLQTAMKQTTGLKRIYCRFRCDRERRIDDVLRLSAQGWTRTWCPLTSSYSMLMDLKRSEQEIMAGCERNWRRNLKNSWERNLTVRQWENPEPDAIMSVFASMEKVKGLEAQYSRQEIESILNTWADSMVLYRCDDERGELLSFLACLVVGERAMFWLSACNERGREKLAAYAVFWGMLQHCLNSGLKEMDLAGIDPIGNPGVYRFKRASGARALEYLGEWDWASSSWLRWFGNWAISQRARLRKAESALTRSSAENVTTSAPNVVNENLAHPKLA